MFKFGKKKTKKSCCRFFQPVKRLLGSKRFWFYVCLLAAAFVVWQYFLPAPLEGNWQPHTAVMPTVEIKGHLATVYNVRNFRYSGEEEASQIDYYNRTYDLDKLQKIWFVTEPFSQSRNAAHTFLSFEFSDGKYLAISIEARKVVGQTYGIFRGLFRVYPLMYIATDERDAILARANVRHHDVYLYPVKTTPDKARAILTDMLLTMNDLIVHPRWYNTITANCTSLIAGHVNRVTPGKLPFWSWRLLFTGHADELALKAGLLDTDLNIGQARLKYNISPFSREIGDVPDYSQKIRQSISK
ncbi:MAG: DUF4105 domain-containing protein [Candidatus Falkowbacteria bacterium]